ncbi:Uncharacterised protein [Mycobacteroides abscessus subsp. abscessus]|nr:Uncharacterised protein [Mycobacteroides abscessus subsp. abscessus]
MIPGAISLIDPPVVGSHSTPRAASTSVRTALIGSGSVTTTEDENSHAPATTRCAVPIALIRPATLTLYSPGQYSPGISPTRASTPRERSTSA